MSNLNQDQDLATHLLSLAEGFFGPTATLDWLSKQIPVGGQAEVNQRKVTSLVKSLAKDKLVEPVSVQVEHPAAEYGLVVSGRHRILALVKLAQLAQVPLDKIQVPVVLFNYALKASHVLATNSSRRWSLVEKATILSNDVSVLSKSEQDLLASYEVWRWLEKPEWLDEAYTPSTQLRIVGLFRQWSPDGQIQALVDCWHSWPDVRDNYPNTARAYRQIAEDVWYKTVSAELNPTEVN